MKKIFILTGEPSGDKLASTVISKLKSQNPNIEYSSVGGNHLKKLGINSIFNFPVAPYKNCKLSHAFKLPLVRLLAGLPTHAT